jgi:hypothetical protein
MGDAVSAADAESKPLDNKAFESTRRTYTPPSLSSYGTLRDITLHMGSGRRFDGAVRPNKTSK